MKYILPGMGATSRMYAGPWRGIRDAYFIDWPAYGGEATLADLARSLINSYPISRHDCVIGTSMGGMVALEIDKLIGLRSVFLVAGAVHPDELKPLSRAFLPFVSRSIIKTTQRLAAFSRQLVQNMYATSDPDFIVAMSRAIRSWPGYGSRTGNVFRIHGRKDRIIACPDDCAIIEDGGHLIAITHARTCVDFITAHLA